VAVDWKGGEKGGRIPKPSRDCSKRRAAPMYQQKGSTKRGPHPHISKRNHPEEGRTTRQQPDQGSCTLHQHKKRSLTPKPAREKNPKEAAALNSKRKTDPKEVAPQYQLEQQSQRKFQTKKGFGGMRMNE
jgi:hypothetical protein